MDSLDGINANHEVTINFKKKDRDVVALLNFLAKN